MADAGLIEGSYTGVTNQTAAGLSGSSTTTPNTPTSKYPSAIWMSSYAGPALVSDTSAFEGDYGNILMLGTGVNAKGILFTPEDAWNIDTKMDDGKPGTGRVTTRKTAVQANSATGCSNVDYTTATSIAGSSAYFLSNTSVICTLIFKTGS